MGPCCGVGAGIGDLVALPVCEGSFSWAAGLEGGYGAEGGLLSERERDTWSKNWIMNCCKWILKRYAGALAKLLGIHAKGRVLQ